VQHNTPYDSLPHNRLALSGIGEVIKVWRSKV